MTNAIEINGLGKQYPAFALLALAKEGIAGTGQLLGHFPLLVAGIVAGLAALFFVSWRLSLRFYSKRDF